MLTEQVKMKKEDNVNKKSRSKRRAPVVNMREKTCFFLHMRKQKRKAAAQISAFVFATYSTL